MCLRASACVLYTMARVERLNLLTVTTRWHVKAEFIFPLFYNKYSSGLHRAYAARTWKKETRAGSWRKHKGGEDEAWKCSAPSTGRDANPHSVESSALLANNRLQHRWLGFRLSGILSSRKIKTLTDIVKICHLYVCTLSFSLQNGWSSWVELALGLLHFSGSAMGSQERRTFSISGGSPSV